MSKKPIPSAKHTAEKLQQVTDKIKKRVEKENEFQLPESLQGFEEKCKLGHGTYGSVVSYLNSETGVQRAVKIMKCENDESPASAEFPASAVRESSLLNELKLVPGVIYLHDLYFRPNPPEIWLVLEHMQQDLSAWIKNSWDRTKICNIMKQLLEATKACHERHIVHRDMKPQNILLNQKENGELILKIADFGLARQIFQFSDQNPIELMSDVVTAWYRDPQLFFGCTKYAYEIDIWSIGCIFAELLNKKPLFTIQHTHTHRNEIEEEKETEEEKEKVKEEEKIRSLDYIFSKIGCPGDEQECGRIYTFMNKKKYLPYVPRWKQYGIYSKIDPKKIKSTICSGWSDVEIDLFVKLLDLNPETRITAGQALKNAYFNPEAAPLNLCNYPSI